MPELNASPQHTGLRAFLHLVKWIHEETERQFTERGDYPEDESEDPRDYVAIVEAIEASLRANVLEAAPAQREGYLRCLADLFCINLDGCGVDMLDPDWHPLRSTERAFAGRR